jgi:hypothetical protein
MVKLGATPTNASAELFRSCNVCVACFGTGIGSGCAVTLDIQEIICWRLSSLLIVMMDRGDPRAGKFSGTSSGRGGKVNARLNSEFDYSSLGIWYLGEWSIFVTAYVVSRNNC